MYLGGRILTYMCEVLGSIPNTKQYPLESLPFWAVFCTWQLDLCYFLPSSEFMGLDYICLF